MRPQGPPAAVGVDGPTPGAGSAACSECGTHASASASSSVVTANAALATMATRQRLALADQNFQL